MSDEADTDVSKRMSRIFLMLYLQFAFYWATIAVGMVANYYYSVPVSVQPTAVSVLQEIVTSPVLVAHVGFAILSTGMSAPIILVARRVGLRQVVWLHVGSMSARIGGFVGGPLFIYYSTSSVGSDFLAGVSTFVMASAFMLAVILSFMSRIFIVREDVRRKYMLKTDVLSKTA